MSKNINKIQISSSEDDKLQLGGNWLAKKLWRLEYWIREKVYSIRRDIDSHYSELNDVIGHIGPNGKNIITLQNNVSTLQGNWAQYTLCDTIIWFTGEEIHYQAYRSSEFIAINRQYPIIVRANFAIGDPSKAWLALYAADFSFIGAIYHNGNAIDATIANGVCTLEAEKIPSNAVYFRTCVQESEISNSYYTNGPTQEAREGAVNNATSAVVKALDNKVDKIEEKGLSSNDYTDADKVKLSELPTNEGLSAALATKADRTELSNIVGTPSEGVIEDLEPTLVTEALRKTAQTLTPAEQEQVKKNIGVSKMELFIDMWNARATIRGRSYGGYEPENAPDPSTPFKLNDIWLSYADAIKVMNEPAGQPLKHSGFYTYGVSRTYFPILACSGSIESVGLYNHNLEVVRILSHDMVYNNADPDTALIPLNNTTGAFMHCFKLREVKGILKLSASDYQGKHFHNGLWMCGNLETIWLHSVSLNLSIASCQKIKVECLRYMVENAANTKAITITVHKDVFAKLTDEANTDWHQVLTDATNKNITFATL